jgi:hypothetical protein
MTRGSGRPRGTLGEISRMVLAQAVHMAAERAQAPLRGATTWRDLEPRLVAQGVGTKALRHTVKNLARLGHLQPAATVRVPGVSRALQAYLPAAPAEARQAPSAAQQLADITRHWRSA